MMMRILAAAIFLLSVSTAHANDMNVSGSLRVNGSAVCIDPGTGCNPLGTTIESSEITDGTIANVDVSSSAAIAVSKLSVGAGGQLLLSNGTPTPVPTWTSLGGDGAIGATGSLDLNAQAVTFDEIVNSAAAGLSVVGRSTNSAGSFAEIAAGTDGHVLRRSGTALGFGTLGTTSLTAGAVDGTILRDSAGFSVIGKATTGTGDPADIVAADETVLGRTAAGNLAFAALATNQIAANAVTNAKAAQMAAGTIKGNNTAGTANALDLTATQVTAMLNTFGALKGLVPANGGASTTFLRADGTWQTPTGSGEANTYSNVGAGGVGVTLTKSGVNLPFKSINAFSTKVSVTNDVANSEVDIDVVPANIDHDALLNWSLSEHVDHAGVSITAGSGLTGGGTIASTRDIAVGDGAGISVAADAIATASNELSFLSPVADGSFACGSSRSGAMATVAGGGTLMFCDDTATTTVKKYVALTTSSTGALPTHTHAGSDINSSVVGTTYGGTGQNWSLSSGIPLLSSGTASLLSSTGAGNVVRAQSPQFNPASASTAPFTVGSNATNVLVSGLNADQIDGVDATAFVQLAGTQTVTGAKTFQAAITSDVADGVTGFTMTNDATDSVLLVNGVAAPLLRWNVVAGGSSDTLLQTQVAAANQYELRADGQQVWYDGAGTVTATMNDQGNAGIKIRQPSANTATPNRVLLLDADSTGTPGQGFGADIDIVLEDSLLNDTDNFAGRIRTQWIDATTGSRDSVMKFSVVSSAAAANTTTEALHLNGDDNGTRRMSPQIPGVVSAATGWITPTATNPTLTPSPSRSYIVTGVDWLNTVAWTGTGCGTPTLNVGTTVTAALFISGTSTTTPLQTLNQAGHLERHWSATNPQTQNGLISTVFAPVAAGLGAYQSASATLKASVAGCTTPTTGRTHVTVYYVLIDPQP